MSERNPQVPLNKPKPGSDEAIKEGCTCNPYDNNHGRFAPMGDEWHIDPGCPIHDLMPEP